MMKCPIWGTNIIEVAGANGDFERVNSPRAGGWYEITRSAVSTLEKRRDPLFADTIIDSRVNARLTTWLVEQRKMGEDMPKITTSIIDEAKSAKNLSIVERRNRLLICVNESKDSLSDDYFLSDFYEEEASDEDQALMAITESVDCRELETLFNFAVEKGLMQEVNGGYKITFDGHCLIEELGKSPNVSTQAFVAMWFDASMNDPYLAGIEPAIKEVGYKPVRIDNVEHNNKIDDEIIAEIRRSKFIVADFTCGVKQLVSLGSDGKTKTEMVAIPRGGVYYEAGFAQGLGIPVIWTCRQDQIEKVHFDTRQFNHITWTTPEELKEKLVKRIGAVIGDGPLKNAAN